MTTFTDELALIGCYTDPHIDEHDGREYETPSIIREEDHGEAT